ncbi:hypothetical protein F4861DRAFT_410852 [Xylaria intraflava]|nr:hypothetical protein F4861DRAFT_410852 [Xylaria intraflava]
MESARKIELQAPEDLAYLVANVRRAAAARIDEAFPPVEDSSEDELRTRIEALVNEVRQTRPFFFFLLFYVFPRSAAFRLLCLASMGVFSQSTHVQPSIYFPGGVCVLRPGPR